MANPSLVQALSGNTYPVALGPAPGPGQPGVPVPPPTITLPNPVGAGNLLVACLIYKGTADPTPYSDNLGNRYTILNGVSGSGLCACVCFAFNVAGGSTTLTVPTVYPCAFAVHEFTGVLATSAPNDATFSMAYSKSPQTFNLDYSLSQAHELVFVASMSPANEAMTLPSGLTVIRTEQSANGSLQTGWAMGPAQAQSTGTITETMSATYPTATIVGTFLHA